jgi:DnaK suppressor protein
MREGKYGLCETCEENIPLARLQALPYATLCIGCQRESEKAGRGSGRAADWGRILDTGGGDAEVRFSDIEMDVT